MKCDYDSMRCSIVALLVLSLCACQKHPQAAPTHASAPPPAQRAHAAPAATQVPPPPPGGPGGMPPMPSIAQTKYQAAVYIDNGRYLAAKSTPAAVQSGQVTDTGGSGLRIRHDGNDFNGVLVLGSKSDVTLQDASIDLKGDGSNDILGIGAGVMVAGDSTLVLRHVDVTTTGVVASAAFAGGHGTLKAYDSTFRSNGGTLPPGYVPKIGPGMKTPPWPLGITGTARATLTTGDSRSYYYHSTIITKGWGALSTDACRDAYLEADDSTVQVLDSGYGAYADNGCTVVIDRSKIDSATYDGIIAGTGKMTFADDHAIAGKNAVMIHNVMGLGTEVAHLTIDKGEFSSGAATVLVKSANADIEIEDARLTSKDGILLKAIVNSDPNATKVKKGQHVPGIHVSIEDSSLKGDLVDQDPKHALSITLQGSTLTGTITDATLSLDAGSQWHATGDSSVTLVMAADIARIDAPADVTITAKAAPGAHFPQVRYPLHGGGVLIVAEP